MLTPQERVAEMQAVSEAWTPQEALRWGLWQFDTHLSIASSFGAEDVVLIDMASRLGQPFRVFTLDTDFLFPETYGLIDAIEEHYHIKVERTHPELTPDEQAAKFGPALWSSNPNQCCDIRKVQPLQNYLSKLQAWVTGIRRDQAPTRANAKKLEWDARFGLVKVNPLVEWNWTQVWDYIKEFEVPYNPLHDQNYPSIGCTYCTRPVQIGEDPRAGRWSGSGKIECGLHLKTI
jgi:phosphoadenosine phosphosulfate reductase